MKQRNSYTRNCVALAVALAPTLAWAHSGDTLSMGVFAGFLHPFTGVDHIGAMVAAGLWAMHISRHALPSFLVATAIGIFAGAIVGAYGGGLTLAEAMTAVSAGALALLALFAARVRVHLAAVLVALFSFFHGYAHAAETPQQFSQSSFTFGFLAAMLTLQALGAWFAAAMARHDGQIRWPDASTDSCRSGYRDGAGYSVVTLREPRID